jgi:hypothetical protein
VRVDAAAREARKLARRRLTVRAFRSDTHAVKLSTDAHPGT